jgi:branched-subunit amino acid ABC-type transport system permease component
MKTLMPFIVVGLVNGSIYAIAGLGLVLTYKTSGIFNFAHGAVAAAVAYAFYELRTRNNVPWPIALLLCMLVIGPAIGLFLERLAARLGTTAVATKIMATLGLLVVIQQLAINRYGGQTRAVDQFLPTDRFRVFDVNIEVGQAIIVVIALGAACGLSFFFKKARLGRAMRGVVDNPELVELTGTNATAVRRWAWCIGSSFAGISGVLLAPTIGLDANILTLLVVQAFGAAAVGFFTSLPLTYLGGLVIGLGAALSTKYVGDINWLGGLPPSLPFVVLFAVLVLAPRRRLVQISVERPRRPVEQRRMPPAVKRGGLAALVLVTVAIPHIVGTRTLTYAGALVYVIIFLSLALLERTSGQVSLAHLGFAAVGASAFSHFASTAGIPWVPAVLLAALVTVPVGALIAIPALRLSGIYLALATFGFGLLLEYLAFQRSFMFGGGNSALLAPRPSFARSDAAYYYIVVVFVVAVAALVAIVHRSRLGRLLRGMSDSPVALTTYGVNITVVKVAVFSISAFLAGLGGALYGPVTGRATPASFRAFASLMLVVVLGLQGAVAEHRAALGAAITLIVVPAYVTRPSYQEWFPVLFGVAAILVALMDARDANKPVLPRASALAARRAERTPVTARLEEVRADLAEASP